jgi:uncharacterized membrane protein
MIKVEWFYWLVGVVFLVMAAQMVTDRTNPRRLGTAAFWGLLGAGFVYGTYVVDKRAPAEPLGAAVLVMACLAGFGLTGRGTPRTTTPAERAASSARLGNRLFVPALTIPIVAVVCATLGKHWSIGGSQVLEKGSETILGLGIGSIVALAVAMTVLRERRITAPPHAGRSMLEAMGWAMLLPQMLSTLGSIFQVSGVGTAVGRITSHVLPHGMVYVALIVYCVGMAVFTMVMGNAFAAFPAMTAAVGWPVLVLTAGRTSRGAGRARWVTIGVSDPDGHLAGRLATDEGDRRRPAEGDSRSPGRVPTWPRSIDLGGITCGCTDTARRRCLG